MRHPARGASSDSPPHAHRAASERANLNVRALAPAWWTRELEGRHHLPGERVVHCIRVAWLPDAARCRLGVGRASCRSAICRGLKKRGGIEGAGEQVSIKWI